MALGLLDDKLTRLAVDIAHELHERLLPRVPWIGLSVGRHAGAAIGGAGRAVDEGDGAHLARGIDAHEIGIGIRIVHGLRRT